MCIRGGVGGSSEWTDVITDEIPVMEMIAGVEAVAENAHFHLLRFLIDLRDYEELCVHTISEPR